jgi:hypothetical protein
MHWHASRIDTTVVAGYIRISETICSSGRAVNASMYANRPPSLRQSALIEPVRLNWASLTLLFRCSATPIRRGILGFRSTTYYSSTLDKEHTTGAGAVSVRMVHGNFLIALKPVAVAIPE